jgi:hypothetical protein
VLCTVEIADTVLQQDQGMHGSFIRADTMNFMAAIGPDFKAGFVSDAPVSYADMGKTIAHVLGLKIPFHGMLMGRIAEAALPGGAMPLVKTLLVRSKPDGNGSETMMARQRIGQLHYFDAVGLPGRSVGLEARKAANR